MGIAKELQLLRVLKMLWRLSRNSLKFRFSYSESLGYIRVAITNKRFGKSSRKVILLHNS